MLNRLVVFANTICAIVLVSSGLAFGQATTGPGEQTGSAGAETEFAFSLTRGGENVAIFGFNILVTTPLEEVLEPVFKADGQPGEVDCTVESDIDAAVDALVFDIVTGEGETRKHIIAVSFGDLAFPLSNITRDGVIGRCKMRVKTGVEPGAYPLPCDPASGATSATDADGNPVDITCEDGTLTVEDLPTVTPTSTVTITPPGVTNTPTATRTNTRPVGGGGDDEDDGCHIDASGGSSAIAWLMLAPVAVFVLRRRFK